jgi:capsular polysaccharide transport system permease protein
MSFARGLAVQADVVGALILRETRTRFGAHQLGYLWALLEPTLMILTFLILFAVGKRDAPDGMDAFSFIATGILPYLVFSHTAVTVSNAIRGNRGLLFYPHVQPLDLVIARCLLEWATFAAVFLALMLGRALYAQELHIDSALRIVGGFALAAMLGASLGLVFCTLDQLSRVVDRVKGPLMRPLFWISGLFFTAEQLPDRVREVMLVNPLLHAVEMVRDGWFIQYHDEHVSVSYVLAWILGMSFVGLALERVVRRRIELT